MRNFKEALDDFIGSSEWKDCSDPVTLMAPPRMREFLQNRLKRAFEAGWTSRDNLEDEQAADKSTESP